MEQNVIVSFQFFDQSLVQRVIDFTELSDEKKTKEAIKSFSGELKSIYLEKDAQLKQHIKQQLAAMKQAHLDGIAELEKNLERDLAEAVASNTDPKELHNVKFGLETVCKRAKISALFSSDHLNFSFLYFILTFCLFRD